MARNTYWCWYVSTGDALNRSIEIIKGLALHNLSADFTSNTKLREATFNRH